MTTPIFFEDDAGEWRAQLKAANGEVVYTSEGYRDRSDAERGLGDLYATVDAVRERTEADVLRIIVRRLLDGWELGDNCDPDTPESDEWAWERCHIASSGSWLDERERFEGVMGDREGTAIKRTRGTSFSPQDFFVLDQWGRQLYEVFRNRPYLVGSVARDRADYRDVDVRMLLPDAAYGWVMEVGSIEANTSLRLKTINLGLTEWGRRVTGMPIDFQMQPSDEFHSHDGEYRSALGISINQLLTLLNENEAARDSGSEVPR